MTRISITVDGVAYSDEVENRTLLVQYLREQVGKIGTVIGCDTTNCGACTVHLDGHSVKSCTMLAVQADGRRVDTIEGLSDTGTIRDLQQAFVRHNALQCGFCTSGMLMAASELLEHKPHASREEVREWISGNYCRCTGYQAIVNAICEVLAARNTARTAGATA